ncbi:DUF6777 domain-containing protein [Gordonia sp. NPDC003585]|uniref:DUF6777 domain-containing protein n=1 Tax=Gordonia sp. NPDC003585 TaxID=3154275 RepID=UPI0033A17670
MSYYPPGPPTSPSGAFTGPMATPPRNRRALTFVLSAIVVVLALVLAAGVVLVVKARDGSIQIPGLTLTSAEDRGVDPFTTAVAVAKPSSLGNVKLSAQVGYPTQGTVTVNGSQPGLYGVYPAETGASSIPNQLSRQYAAKPAAGRAFGKANGISEAAVPYYLNTLTPVVLTRDTWVTDHRYANESASPYQAVLEAGTCVLVDPAGVPRVRCISGSPLGPPAAAPVGGYRLEGNRWDGYETERVTRICYQNQYVTTINNTTTIIERPAPGPQNGPRRGVLEVVDVRTGIVAPRPVGGGVDLYGLPPLPAPLPDPFVANTPFVATDEAQAKDNGLARPGSPLPATEVTERATANRGVPEGAPESETSAARSSSLEVTSTPGGLESTAVSTTTSVPAFPRGPLTTPTTTTTETTTPTTTTETTTPTTTVETTTPTTTIETTTPTTTETTTTETTTTETTTTETTTETTTTETTTTTTEPVS